MNWRKLNVFLTLTAVVEIAAFFYVTNQPEPQVLGVSGEVKLASQKLVLPEVSLPVPFDTSISVTPISYSVVENSIPKISPTPTPKLQVRVASTSISKRTSTPVTVTYSAPADVEAIIVQYANQYGVDSNLMIKIAKCESGFRADAVSGPYGGMYQFLATTWASNRRAMGLDPDPNLRFNAEEAIKTTAFKIARDGAGAWPVCSKV